MYLDIEMADAEPSKKDPWGLTVTLNRNPKEHMTFEIHAHNTKFIIIIIVKTELETGLTWFWSLIVFASTHLYLYTLYTPVCTLFICSYTNKLKKIRWFYDLYSGYCKCTIVTAD